MVEKGEESIGGMRVRNDAPYNWNINFQDTGSLIGEGIINLHNRVITYSIVIMIVVLYMMTVTIIRYRNNKIVEKYSNHSTSIEIIWTIIPTIIIMIILGPSFVLLYMIDEVIEPIITVKFIGFLVGGLKLYIFNKRKDTNSV